LFIIKFLQNTMNAAANSVHTNRILLQ